MDNQNLYRASLSTYETAFFLPISIFPPTFFNIRYYQPIFRYKIYQWIWLNIGISDVIKERVIFGIKMLTLCYETLVMQSEIKYNKLLRTICTRFVISLEI